MTGPKLTYAVIGAGSIGGRHIRNLVALGRGVVVVDPSPSIRRKVKRIFPGVSVYSDLKAMPAECAGAALICTPTNSHIPAALACARRGMHLFIEKPLSHQIAGIGLLRREAAVRKLITMVGCNMRFQYGLKRLRQLSALVGRVFSIRCYFGQYLPDWRPGRDYTKTYSASGSSGGGVMLDAVHEFDYLLDLMPGKPVSISAMAATSGLLRVTCEDNAAVTIRFDDGAIGEIHLDYLNREYTRGCVIAGERGTIAWDEREAKIRVSLKGRRPRIEREPRGSGYGMSYIDELLHFEHCIRIRTETVNPLSLSLKVLRLVLAARRSSERMKHVKVDWE